MVGDMPSSANKSAKSQRFAPAPSANDADTANELLVGLQHHGAGRLDEAEQIYRRVLSKLPNHADALHLNGVMAFARGRTDDAIRLIGRAVKVLPSFIDAHLNLAEAYRMAGRSADAADSYRRVIALKPDHAAAHSHLGRVLCELGTTPEVALGHCRVAVALDPAVADTHRDIAYVLRRIGRMPEAEAAYREALRLQPDDATALNELGTLLGEADRFDEALDCHQRAAALRPGDGLIRANLAASCYRNDDMAGAAAAFAEAVRLLPGLQSAWLGGGDNLRALGRFDEAAVYYKRALELDQDCALALHGLAQIRRKADERGDIERLERMLGHAKLAPKDRVVAGFTLGKLLADERSYDNAFARFAAANALYRKLRNDAGESFDARELIETVNLLVRGRGREYIDDTQGWGNPSELPAFIVGLPRSGTSLVEQICASHSRVHGAGELNDVTRMAKAITIHNEGKAAIADWDPAFARGLADRHVATLKARGHGAARVVDKLPFNALRLGMVSALFPNARVVICRRDPRDVAISNHTIYYARGNLWSTDLGDCGVVCREVGRLTEFWRGTSPLRILTVDYEALVGDLDSEARRLIAFLGLDWESACFDFHRTDRVVNTPSDWQVRQPIFSSSVGRWRPYERHMGPLLAALESPDGQ